MIAIVECAVIGPGITQGKDLDRQLALLAFARFAVKKLCSLGDQLHITWWAREIDNAFFWSGSPIEAAIPDTNLHQCIAKLLGAEKLQIDDLFFNFIAVVRRRGCCHRNTRSRHGAGPSCRGTQQAAVADTTIDDTFNLVAENDRDIVVGGKVFQNIYRRFTIAKVGIGAGTEVLFCSLVPAAPPEQCPAWDWGQAQQSCQPYPACPPVPVAVGSVGSISSCGYWIIWQIEYLSRKDISLDREYCCDVPVEMLVHHTFWQYQRVTHLAEQCVSGG